MLQHSSISTSYAPVQVFLPRTALSFEDIRHEFRLETAFEGLYWYFIVRRGYYQQQEMVNYINNQYRKYQLLKVIYSRICSERDLYCRSKRSHSNSQESDFAYR